MPKESDHTISAEETGVKFTRLIGPDRTVSVVSHERPYLSRTTNL